MSKAPVEVRVHARGSVQEGNPKADASVEARCDLCASVVDAVASVGPEARAAYACKSCLRERLEGITVALWMLRDSEKGLPWGKISG
jgi:hypothetical protein